MKPLHAVLLGGFNDRDHDNHFAIGFSIYSGGTAVRLLQSVSSGVLGRDAFTGGMQTAVLGLALHFTMAFMRAAASVAAAMLVPALARHPVVSGIVSGALVFLVMRRIVLPLSAFPFPVTYKPFPTIMDLLSHMLLFGVPIAWAAARALRRGT